MNETLLPSDEKRMMVKTGSCLKGRRVDSRVDPWDCTIRLAFCVTKAVTMYINADRGERITVHSSQ